MNDDDTPAGAGGHAHLPPDPALRVQALESLLVSKGLVEPEALNAIIDRYANEVGPRNGARGVAKAWSQPAYRDWLLRDGTAAIASLGYTGRQGEPRTVLAEFGVALDPGVEIRVWDSTSEMRYLVIPERPRGTAGWSEEALAGLVTRDAMIGTGLARQPEAAS